MKISADRQCFLIVCATLLLCVGGTPVWAQTQSLFGNRGPVGQIGSNLSGSIVGQGTTFGAAQGNNLTGRPIPGQLGGAPSGTLQQGTAGTGFVGRGDNAGRFVGDQRIGRQPTRMTGSGRFPNAGGRTSHATGALFGGSRNGSRSRRAPRVIRPRQQIAFRYPQHRSSTIVTNLRSRFRRISQRQSGLQGVIVSIDEQGTTILSGTVDSVETKSLASILAGIEPGVRTVRNELAVRDKAQ